MTQLPMKCDEPVVGEWARKLSPLCKETKETCATWLAAFLTAIRLARCEGLPEEDRSCGHEDPVVGGREAGCTACLILLAKRDGHTEAGVFWTAGEVMARGTHVRLTRHV